MFMESYYKCSKVTIFVALILLSTKILVNSISSFPDLGIKALKIEGGHDQENIIPMSTDATPFTNLNHMVMDHYSHIPIIYVVGNDSLYALNALDLSPLASVDLSYSNLCKYEEYVTFCAKRNIDDNTEGEDSSKLLNVNKLLLMDTMARRLVVCGTFGGFCQTVGITYTPTSTVSSPGNSKSPRDPDRQVGSTILRLELELTQLSTTQVVSELLPSSTLSFLAVQPLSSGAEAYESPDYYRDGLYDGSPPKVHSSKNYDGQRGRRLTMYLGETYLGPSGKLWSEFQSSSLSLRSPDRGFSLVNDGISGGQSRLQILKDLSHSYKVAFEYGFVADGFAYTLTLQPDSTGLRNGAGGSTGLDLDFGLGTAPHNPTLRAKISRVCVRDDTFHTYVEIPLECRGIGSLKRIPSSGREGEGGVLVDDDRDKGDYPILKRAWFGNVGQDLARGSDVATPLYPYYFASQYDDRTSAGEMNTDTRMLVAVFGKKLSSGRPKGFTDQSYYEPVGYEPSRSTTTPSKINDAFGDMAICTYPIGKINDAFTLNIRMCYNGTYQTRGLGHINPGNPKCIKSNTFIGNDFCDTTKPNPRLEGRMALKSDAIYQVDNASTVTAFTVGVSGKYTVGFWGTQHGHIKKILLEKNGSTVYSTNKIDPGGNAIQKDIFVDPSSKSIFALTTKKVYKINIASCSSYKDCLSCMEASDPYCGWCTHDNKCSLQSECKTASVYSRWLPFRSKQCVYFNSIKPERAELTQLTSVHLNISHLPSLIPNSHYVCIFGESNPIKAQIQPWGLKCQLPSYEERPAINPKEGFAQVPLQISSNVSTKIILAEQSFTFYDCTHLTSCRSCLSAEWNCNWCLYENVCLYHTLPCQTVISKALFQGVKDHPNPTEKCPKFDYDFNPNILIPNQVATEISIKGKNLPKPLAGQTGYSCLVEFDNYSVHIKATLNKNERVVNCQPYIYLYPNSLPQITGKLTVLWNEKHQIDSTEITLYKCEALASDCTLCNNLDPLYKCTWCHDSNSCLHTHQCPKTFQDKQNTKCPAPSQLNVDPIYGPKEGGTIVTITGHDLVQKKMNEIRVMIGKSLCVLQSFEISTKITCKTSPSQSSKNERITIYTNRSPSLSTHNFSYLDADIYSITPNKGPMSGGTKLIIRGNTINIGSSKKIFLDYIPCLILESSSPDIDSSATDLNTLTCLSQPVFSAPLKIDKITIQIDNFEKTIPQVYEYMPDPVIYSISPMESFTSGGRAMLITGNSFDLISDAYMFLNLRDNGTPKTKCDILNSTLMICSSPALPYPIQSKSAFYYESIPFGFIVDGVNSLKNLSAYYPHLGTTIKYYPDPEFYPFTEEGNVKRFKGESIIIEGSNMVWADELKVMIGTVECPITIISVTHLVCMPPSSIDLTLKNDLDPTLTDLVNEEDNQLFPVWVSLGNIKTNVGYLHYSNLNDPIINKISGKPAKFMVVSLTICGFIFIIVSAIVLIIFNRRSRLAEKEYKRIQIQMETLESNVRSECKQAFAELQTDMCDVTNDLIISGIPFYDRKAYVSKIYFPDMSCPQKNWLFMDDYQKTIMDCDERIITGNPYELCYNLLQQNIDPIATNNCNAPSLQNDVSSLQSKESIPFSHPNIYDRINNAPRMDSKHYRASPKCVQRVTPAHQQLERAQQTPELYDCYSVKCCNTSLVKVDKCMGTTNYPKNYRERDGKPGATLLIDLSSSSSSTNEALMCDDTLFFCDNGTNGSGDCDKRVVINPQHALGLVSQPYDKFIPSFDCATINCPTVYYCPDLGNPFNALAPFPRTSELNGHTNLSNLEFLLYDKYFLLNFMATLESQPGFTVKDRTVVASLIGALLLPNVEYNVEILMSLMDKLIERSVTNRAQQMHLLMRRTESIAEKMLTNILSLYMYDYLKDYAGTSFFYLFKALKYQIEKGPVDAITYDARYSLSEDRLLVEKVDYKILTIWVSYGDDPDVDAIACKVNDCDSITQVKLKIIETFYKNSPYTSRPYVDDLDLVWKHGKCGPIVLRDEDATTLISPNGMRIKLNTLQHYRLSEGAILILLPKQNTYETIDTNCVPKNKINQHPATTATQFLNLYGLNRTLKTLHNSTKILPSSPILYNITESSSNESGSSSLTSKISPFNTATKNNTTKMKLMKPAYWHLVNPSQDCQDDDFSREQTHNISEIFLTRLLSTKGTIQKFVDDFFFTIFKADTNLPCFIKYLFDYLDYQAEKYMIADPLVVHSWKNNCLPLRFWVNIIKNPDFVFDVHKTHTIDSSLSVLAQTFMDSCSLTEHRLGKDSPSNKLLYAKEIPNYRKHFQKFYNDIRDMPKVKDEKLRESMAQLSQKQSWNIKKDAILAQIYQYTIKYKTEIFESLESDYTCNKMHLPLLFASIFGQNLVGNQPLPLNTIYDTIDTFSIKKKKGYSLLQSLTPNNINTNNNFTLT